MNAAAKRAACAHCGMRGHTSAAHEAAERQWDAATSNEGERPWDDADGYRRLPPLRKAELKAAPHWARDMRWTLRKKRLVPAACVGNVKAILRHDARWRGCLALNVMGEHITLARRPPWHAYEPRTTIGDWDADVDPTRLVDWLDRAYGMVVAEETAQRAALNVAQDRRFHPVASWLKQLPPHDGVRRVEEFFARYAGAQALDEPMRAYLAAVGRVLLVSMVARAFEPGCKADCVVVLEGPQGAFKSTLCKTLASDAWFGECTADITSKDAQLAMHGKWLLELPELTSMRKSDVEASKAFFSRSNDWLRPPYGRKHKNLKRSSVPIATTNADRYLADRTGNRRYLPIECGTIDIAALIADRDQIFAEALAMYRSNVPWWITDSAVLAAASIQTASRETGDPWEEQLDALAREKPVNPRDGNQLTHGQRGLTYATAFERLGIGADRQTDAFTERLRACFKRIGLVQRRPRDRRAEREARESSQKYERPRKWYFAE